jgi:FkbH-like protein
MPLDYSSLWWLPESKTNLSTDLNGELKGVIGAQLRGLATTRLDVNRLCKLARHIKKLRNDLVDFSPLMPVTVALVSNVTSDIIADAITATAPRLGLNLLVKTFNYDQVAQLVFDPGSDLYTSKPDLVFFALDARGLPLATDVLDDSGEEEAKQFLRNLRDAVKHNSSASCIFQTLTLPPTKLFGNMDRRLKGTSRRQVLELNDFIVDHLLSDEDYLIDLEEIASTVGLGTWHDPVMWFVGKLPFALSYVPFYADQVCRLIAAIRGRSRKCLVLDLDNTIWGGIVGDDGMQNLRIGQGDAIGEAFLEVQRMALNLKKRGVVLAVCSKNNEETALNVFREHPDMLLKEDDIALFLANWDDKASNLDRIAETLNLGLDALVLLDDNPAERLQVRMALPEVGVPELPDDPAYYPATIAAAGYFETIAFSEDDRHRADYYRKNVSREQLRGKTTDLQTYLKSLDMHLSVQEVDEVSRGRATQLINKTNQFNLTGRRYSETEIADLCNSKIDSVFSARLTDTFGDNGIIACMVCRKDGNSWLIDTFVMSCRVFGRNVEDAFVQAIREKAGKRGISRIIGEYVPSDRNKMIEDLYQRLDFQIGPNVQGRNRRWIAETIETKAAPEWIDVEWMDVPSIQETRADFSGDPMKEPR